MIEQIVLDFPPTNTEGYKNFFLEETRVKEKECDAGA